MSGTRENPYFRKYIDRTIVPRLLCKLSNPEVVFYVLMSLLLMRPFKQLISGKYSAIVTILFYLPGPYFIYTCSKHLTREQQMDSIYFSWILVKIFALGIGVVMGFALYFSQGSIPHLSIMLLSILWFPSIDFTKYNDNPYISFFIRVAISIPIILRWPLV